jgi:hypothetical protein
MNDSDSPMLAIVDRLGRLEGLITGLQNIISQNQASTTAFMTRVESLEKRQVELERNMVTADHIKGLSDKVDSLIVSDANRKGGTETAKWSVSQIVSWGALLVAILSLVGVGFNAERLQERNDTTQEQQ